ncbi:hypothetical protein D3C84_882130 [compost metagenome]
MGFDSLGEPTIVTSHPSKLEALQSETASCSMPIMINCESEGKSIFNVFKLLEGLKSSLNDTIFLFER